MKNLIFDMHHLLHRTFFSITETDDAETLSSFALHKAMFSMNKMFKKFKPDNVIAAFDNSSWRKLYTDSDKCITHKKYKSNRRKNMDAQKAARYAVFDKHVSELKLMLKEKTGILVLEGAYLEADDIISGYIESRYDENHIIITGDNDYLQLLRYDNVQIYDAMVDKMKSLDEYDNDPDYYIFTKCIRGDNSDFVMSAYPKLRETKMKKAYTDTFTFENIMNHEFTVDTFDDDGNLVEKTFKTKDVFEENKLLMDLRCQPDDIKQLINLSIERCIKERSSYDMFEFMRYCNRNKLKNISSGMDSFTDLFVGRKY